MNAAFAEPANVERVAALTELALDTPEIVLDLDVVRANIDRAATQAREAGVALRPHTKTHKLPQIARLQLGAGAVGVQVAKLGEAEVMASAGIGDILVGYPLARGVFTHEGHVYTQARDPAERLTLDACSAAVENGRGDPPYGARGERRGTTGRSSASARSTASSPSSRTQAFGSATVWRSSRTTCAPRSTSRAT